MCRLLLNLWAPSLIAICGANFLSAEDKQNQKLLRCALVSAKDVTTSQLETLKTGGFDSVVLDISVDDEDARGVDRKAADLIHAGGFELYYWIEVGRNRQLADEHPEWMASLQGHPEWRRFYPSAPQPSDREVTKNYPWVPIHYRESFAAHVARARRLLEGRPQPRGVFLNDLQGAPSACGCGHPLCRWTTDYGPIRTATSLGDDAAAKFVLEIKQLVGPPEVIPVWTTECEEHDGAKDGKCAGVGCFKGICWKAYSKQLMPLAEVVPRIGVLTLYRAFERDLAMYGDEAGWVAVALRTFQVMPPQRGGKPVNADRLIAVIQGWDVTPKQISQQIKHVEQTGASGYVVAFNKIEQSWTPRIVVRPAR